ncbi:MAG: DUF3857 domain-containing protein [Bacteroidales bacterium]|nr:DUF3857 domain-containing protein [Bacteroidales bacterium]MCF8456325.1 DUF3857 domain-containing protein [Bacteroidales bacterium]
MTNLKSTLTLLMLLSFSFLLLGNESSIMAPDKDTGVFGDNDPDFQVTEAPEKWKDESAVILCQKIKHEYFRMLNGYLFHREVARRRILLNDNYAVEKYAVFYFSFSLPPNTQESGIKLIKPDGREIELDLEDAVPAAPSEVPVYYLMNSSAMYKKISIPNLEKGDILDYYFKAESYHRVRTTYSFFPQIYTLSAVYPIVKQKYFFNVGRTYQVNFRSYNGAKKIVEGGPGINEKGHSKEHIRTYLFEDEDREKQKDEYWKYPYLEEPTIKLQVHYVPKRFRDETPIFVNEDGMINDPIDIKEIKDRVLMKTAETDEFVKAIDYKRYKGKKDAKKITDELYYELRDYFTNSNFDGFFGAEARMDGSEFKISPHVFTLSLSEILTKLKIKHKYVIVVDRDYGSFDDVLIINETTTGIKVGDNYYFPFSNFTNPDFIPSELMGAEAIEFDYDPKSKSEVVDFTRFTIPISDHDSNVYEQTMDLSIDNDFNLVNVKSHIEVKGNMKGSYNELALFNVDYMANAPTIGKAEKKKPEKKSKQEKAEEREKKQKKIEMFKESHHDQFEVESYSKFDLVSDGRYENSKELIYNEEFTAKEFAHKAGNNYILNLGSLIGSQIELDKEDMERTANINIDFPKSYLYHIHVKIPEGYSVEGLEEFNINVSNNMGEFISTAKVEEGFIKLDTKKAYKIHQADKSEWPKFVEFLEEAYKLTQKKVVLKR